MTYIYERIKQCFHCLSDTYKLYCILIRSNNILCIGPYTQRYYSTTLNITFNQHFKTQKSKFKHMQYANTKTLLKSFYIIYINSFSV